MKTRINLSITISGILICIVFLFSEGNLKAQVNLNSGLVAYYPFNGNANDESGNAKNGVVVGATLTTDRFGNANSAYSFNGIGDYIKVSNIDADNYNSGLSFGGWVKLRSISGFNTYFSWQPTNTWGSTYIQNTSNGNLEFRFGTGNSANWHETTNKITINQNFFVFATHNPTKDCLYLNGIKVAEYNSGTLNFNADFFYIGRYSDGGQNSNAIIDDVRIYNRAISDDEVLALYNLTPSSTLIENLKISYVSIFPNPITSSIQIKGIERKATITIYNLNAECVLNQPFVENEPVSVSNLPIGIYTLRIQTAKGVIERKLIKK